MDPSNKTNPDEPDVIYSEYESVPEIAKILSVFTDNLPPMLAEMRSTLRGGDETTLESLAHQLKGAGGGYGYPMLTAVAAQLEQAARDGDWEIAAMCIGRLDTLCAAILRGRNAATGEPS
jgi:HPt (histidine-containing phosphotransfer) domain-containing protein